MFIATCLRAACPGLHSRADIFGGDFSEGFTLTGAAGGFTPGGDLGGVINIFGGRGISQLSFELHPGFIPEPERPRINITGKDFRIDGLPVPFGIIDTFIYGELGGQLTGTLESGDALDARFTFPIGTNSRSIIDLIDCPEPSLPLLQAIGLAVLVALRRRSAP